VSTTDPTHRGLAVEFNSVSFAYGGNLVVDELSLRIGAGEFFTLLGPSGCGKTTTLRLVAGVLTPSGGTIRLGDRDVTRIPVHKRHVAMVFQNYALMPHKSVRENVAYGLASAGLGRQERQQRADAALARVGLTGYGERYPAQLSGGQQQRVGLARAVAVDSGVMLLDEPLSNLDTSLRQQMCLELRELQQDLGVTILYVTHDRNEALSMSDRIGVMEDGRILGLGTPAELYERPRDLRIARMLGDVIVLPQSAQSRTSRSGSIALEEPDPDGGSPTLAVRPEHFRVIGPQGPPTASNVLDGQVRRLEYVGAQTNLFVDVPGMGHPLLVRVPADQVASVPAKGEPVRIGWRVADTLELTGPR
jgi:ABC-type Fe3+/spermidine/putrescine transport system ATPase subunit